uniref:Probable DNA polymerase n=1 Tax=Coniophora olivacea TaxID=85977 RepID=A0A896YU16_9AGAM
MKKYILTLIKNRFSEISFPVRFYSRKSNIILSIIKDLFKALLENSGDHKAVYIIGKYKYSDGSIRSLHNAVGIRLDDKFIKEYYSLIKNILDEKSNDYKINSTNNPIKYVFFNFFYIPKGSEGNYVFLFKNISKLNSQGFKIEFIKKEDKIISIKIFDRSRKISITLKDSILLLPMSLAKLSTQFKLEKGKLTEPVYVGEGHDEYKSTDLSHYSKDIERIDDFNVWLNKIEAYCAQDCIALYEVLIKFKDLIFDKFKINIVKYPTTPSSKSSPNKASSKKSSSKKSSVKK